MFKAFKVSKVTFSHRRICPSFFFHFQMGNMMKHSVFTPKLLTWILKCRPIMGTEASAILRLNTLVLLWKMLIKQLTWIRNILRYKMLEKKKIICFLFSDIVYIFVIVFFFLFFNNNNYYYYIGILQESISIHGSWKI